MILQLPPRAPPTPLLPHPHPYPPPQKPILHLPPSPLLLRSPSLSSPSLSSPFREKLNYLEHTLNLDPHLTLSLNPSLRSFPLSSLHSLSSFLSSFGFSPSDSSRIFRMYPHLLTLDPTTSLLPILNFLLGPADVPSPLLRRSVLRCPRLLSSSLPQTLIPSLHFLRRLRFRSFSPNTALLLVLSVPKTLIPKFTFLQSLGFSHEDTVTMVLRSPAIFTFSIETNLMPKVEFLTGEMGRGVEEVKGFPHYFSFSLERRIKERHRMVVENGVERRMGLEEMLRPSDGEFRERLLRWKLRRVGEDV